jgi:hypothetical protein
VTTITPIAATALAPSDPKARAAAQGFEAVLIGQLANVMFETVGDGEGGNAGAIWRGQLAERLGDTIARHGGIGIAPHVEAEIVRLKGGKP